MMLRSGKSKEFYTKAIDKWSLDVFMYELGVGRAPFEMKNTSATQKKMAGYKGKRIKFPAYVSKDAEGLVRELLNLKADERLGFEGVLGHAWVVRHVEKKPGTRSLSRMLEQAA
jgi:serine/threonine protein kinase